MLENIIQKDDTYEENRFKIMRDITNLDDFHDDEYLMKLFSDSQGDKDSPYHSLQSTQSKIPNERQIFDVMCAYDDPAQTWFRPQESSKFEEKQQSHNYNQNVIIQEDQQEEISDFSDFQVKKKGRTVKRKKIIKNTKTDKNKNQFANIALRVIKLMFRDCLLTTKKYLLQMGINFQHFEERFRVLKNEKSCSRKNLSIYINQKEGDFDMNRCFVELFEKYLRRDYMIAMLRNGRMQNKESYIKCKNQQLLYISQY